MEATVTIRRLEIDDPIDKLAQLIRDAYAPLGKRGFNFNGVYQTSEVTARRVTLGVCFVAQIGEELAGTILVHPPFSQAPCEFLTRPEVAYFQQFAVRPSWQALGIGSRLLMQAEACAFGNGYSTLAMDTAADASPLVQYYRRRGYTPVQFMQWPGKNYRSIVMGKPLQVAGPAEAPSTSTE